MKNRKKLDEKASELRHEALISAYLKKAELPEDNANIFRANILCELADFKSYLKTAARTDSEINEAKKPVTAAIGLYNDEMRVQRLEALCKMSRKEAWTEYMKTQYVTGYGLYESDEDGWYIGTNSHIRLQAEDFMSHVCYLEYDGLVDFACILVDNIAKAEFKNDSAAISKRSMSDGYIRLRDGRGWNIDEELSEMSNTKLAKQMTEICTLVSDGACPKMIPADVKYLKFYAIRVTDEANQAGGFKLVSDRDVLRALVRAMYTRFNGLAYPYQQDKSGLRCYDEAPLSEGANKDMAESSMAEEFNPAKQAEASAITFEIPEPEKKPEKKTAKKSSKKSANAEADKK